MNNTELRNKIDELREELKTASTREEEQYLQMRIETYSIMLRKNLMK